MRPVVSVVIPTYNRPGRIKQLLEQLAASLPPWAEIIVVDQSRKPCVFSHERVRILAQKKANLPRARNCGIEAGSGEIIIFLDDDVVPMPRLIETHRKLHESLPQVAVIAGRIRDAHNRGEHAQAANIDLKTMTTLFDFGGIKPQDVDSPSGAHMSFKRAALQTRRFDSAFTGNAHFEEVDLALRLRKHGQQIRFCPEVSVEHALESEGGCRSEKAQSRFYKSHFRNCALCFVKNSQPIKYCRRFLIKQKNDCEFWSRTPAKPGKHDMRMVAACILGLGEGVALGFMRRLFAPKKYYEKNL